MSLRVLVCGGRDYADWNTLRDTLDDIQDRRGPLHIIGGGARGADRLAREWARLFALHGLSTYEADWKTHGRSAGFRRNQRMLDEGRPDVVLVMPGGRGTADMRRRAEAAGVLVILGE